MEEEEDNTVKGKFIKWAESTTFHAIPQIAQTPNKYVKVIWTLCLMLSAGICFYMLSDSVMKYLQYDIETVVSIVDDDRQFPVITFCNMQQCNLDNYEDMSYIQDYLSNDAGKNDTVKSAYDTIRKKFITNQKQVLNSTRDWALKEYLLSCRFDDQDCTYNDFQSFSVSEYVTCYKFNSGKFANESHHPPKELKRASLRYSKRKVF